MFWTTWAGDEASVFAAGTATPVRRLFRVRDLKGFDDVSSLVWTSPSQLAAEFETYDAGVDEDYVDVAAYASGPTGGKRLRAFSGGGRIGFERIQDVAGDEILTLAGRELRGRRTVRFYVRPRSVRPVGPRLVLAANETSSELEGRLVGRWLAVWRRVGGPRVTVYDRLTNRRAWSVRLPRVDDVAWDLGEDGTVAIAFSSVGSGPMRNRTRLGFVRPRSSFRRATTAALPSYPFVLRGSTLTYTAPGRGTRVRLFALEYGGLPRRQTGDLPSATIDTDGTMVAAAVGRAGTSAACILAARLPVSVAARWTCPRGPAVGR